MEKSEETIVVKEEQDSLNPGQRVVRWLAFPIAGLSGLWTAMTITHNGAYNQAKDLGRFKRVQKELEEERIQKGASTLDELQEQLNRNEITTEQFYNESIARKLRYQELAVEQMHKMGLKGFRNKWNYMAKATKNVAIAEGLAVAGIAVGALFAISENKTLHGLIEKHESKDSGPKL
jgi:hypothetical protein